MSLLISVICNLNMSGITIKNEIMIKRLYLYYSVLILTLCSSCNRDVAISNIVEQEENVEVSFFVDSKAIDVDVETDMVPMARTTTTNYNDFCYASGKHIIMKKNPDSPPDSYYVVSITDIACVNKLTGDQPGLLPVNIKLNEYDLKISPVVLQPGEYRSMVVLNSFLEFNAFGTLVDINSQILKNDYFARPRSIYIDTIDFSVTKEGVLTDGVNSPNSLYYDEIERYTTPINIILEGIITNYPLTLSGTLKYNMPQYMNYNGELIYNSSEKSSKDFSVVYDIFVNELEWRFSKYNRELTDYVNIYPLIYTSNDNPTEVNLTIKEIYNVESNIFSGTIDINIPIQHGKPFNILLDFSNNQSPNVIRDQNEINQLWIEANANDDYIPLNYVEYNPDRYE